MVDPINPGAVDSIIHLGDFWNEEGIRKNRDELISNNERIKEIFSRAYNYLAAAGNMYDNVRSIYEGAIKKEELYKKFARIIGLELAHKELSPELGDLKKYFASAITPSGFENYLGTLLNGYKRIYVINSIVGVSAEKMLDLFAESALYRGFNVEGYYCPMKPATKLEHLLVPELGIAFVTSNRFHPVDKSDLESEIVSIDLTSAVKESKITGQWQILEDSQSRMNELLDKAIDCLKLAKKEHDSLEEFYIPNMDFKKIEELRIELTKKIR
ncbi:hypothetical protein [Anaerovorax odorimutans]|uniref:hypothetical protein n=1 Tax=Anaerovorax odorimutans TaxID=109327 RepID=UPI00041AF0DA|nr:hypothetical protein [Anaerovorax odorimutans]